MTYVTASKKIEGSNSRGYTRKGTGDWWRRKRCGNTKDNDDNTYRVIYFEGVCNETNNRKTWNWIDIRNHNFLNKLKTSCSIKYYLKN